MQSVKSDSEGSAAVVGEAGSEKKQRIPCIWCTPLSTDKEPSCDSENVLVDAKLLVAASLKELGLEQRSPSARTYTFPPLPGSGIFVISGGATNPDLRKKKVTFAHSLETQQEASHDLFHYDVLAQWYNLDEYLQMRVECMKTVVLIQIGATISEEDHCKRGLEAHFRQNVSFMKSREDIVDEVLNKQVDLWSEGQGADHERSLAETCIMNSTQHAFKAMVTALHDWKGVQDD
jgi:hypothetical protein